MFTNKMFTNKMFTNKYLSGLINWFYNFVCKICFYYKIIILYPSIYNLINNSKYINDKNYKTNTNIAILLSAGTSSRFESDTPKQLFNYKNKELIMYSIENLVQLVDSIVIVTNSKCIDKISELVEKAKINKIILSTKSIYLIVSDYNCRLESIGSGINYIEYNLQLEPTNILIHDSARPFVPLDYYKNMLSNTNLYSQYGLKLTNGLMDLNFNTLNRDFYVELCSPICINWKLAKLIYHNFISRSNRYTHEFIDVIKIYKINIQIFYGKYNSLRKITVIDDVN